MSVGYATLYGDMAGGFAVLKDVFKSWSTGCRAGATSRRARELDPAVVIERPPLGRAAPRASATRTRCRPTTCSTRSWPAYVEEDRDADELVRRGLPARRSSSA